jgi:hypothetical protein
LDALTEEEDEMTSPENKPERLVAGATIAATVISLFALCVSLYSYRETSDIQKKVAAFTFWQNYLELAAGNPEYANGNYNREDAKERQKYEWFASNALGAAEAVYILQERDPGWKATIQTVIRNHRDYINDPGFKREHYGPLFRALIEKTLKSK